MQKVSQRKQPNGEHIHLLYEGNGDDAAQSQLPVSVGTEFSMPVVCMVELGDVHNRRKEPGSFYTLRSYPQYAK